MRLLMQDVMNMKNWVRSGVRLGPTTVAADSKGLGAFAPSQEMIPRGSFVGVYRAPFWRRAAPHSAYRGKWQSANAKGPTGTRE